MEKITSATGLKNAILSLETDQAIQGQLLKEQFHFAYESIKPVNLIKSTLKDVASSPYLIDNILGTAIGLATGYLSKKIFIGSSGNLFRKLLGSSISRSCRDAGRMPRAAELAARSSRSARACRCFAEWAEPSRI